MNIGNPLGKRELLRLIDELNTRQEYEEEIGLDTELSDSLSDCVDSLLELFSLLYGDKRDSDLGFQSLFS